MQIYGHSTARLIEEFSKLPGIGPKSAQRLAFYVLRLPSAKARALAEAILDARKSIKYCGTCSNLTDQDPCIICTSATRNKNLIMVVEDPRDLAAYERTGQFFGMYHVLHGAISPMHGIGPGELTCAALFKRMSAAPPDEIIIATNPNVEGEATALYLAKTLKPMGFKVTRIAHGVPVGGDIEHVDEVTLSRALEGRREL